MLQQFGRQQFAEIDQMLNNQINSRTGLCPNYLIAGVFLPPGCSLTHAQKLRDGLACTCASDLCTRAACTGDTTRVPIMVCWPGCPILPAGDFNWTHKEQLRLGRQGWEPSSSDLFQDVWLQKRCVVGRAVYRACWGCGGETHAACSIVAAGGVQPVGGNACQHKVPRVALVTLCCGRSDSKGSTWDTEVCCQKGKKYSKAVSSSPRHVIGWKPLGAGDAVAAGGMPCTYTSTGTAAGLALLRPRTLPPCCLPAHTEQLPAS